MKRILAVLGGSLIGGIGGWKLGDEEVKSLFPGFHTAHGYSHEISTSFALAIVGGIVGYHLFKKRTSTEIKDTLKS